MMQQWVVLDGILQQLLPQLEVRGFLWKISGDGKSASEKAIKVILGENILLRKILRHFDWDKSCVLNSQPLTYVYEDLGSEFVSTYVYT